jgi:hypothetical protein
MRALILSSAILIGFCCVSNKSVQVEITVKGFDKEIWKQDSIGCLQKRKELYKILLSNKERLLNKKKSEIESLLGIPNVIRHNKQMYRYFVEKGVQCLGHINKYGYDSLETKSLIVNFNADSTVQKVYEIVP